MDYRKSYYTRNQYGVKWGPMVAVTVFGGVGEVGGNKILLESAESKIFLDFGRNFSRERMFYEEPFLSPRCLEHLLHLRILPDIEGIYSGDGQGVDGVFLSHAHTDHYDAVRYLRDDFPIYSSKITKELILIREYCSPSQSDWIARYTMKGEECRKILMESGPSNYVGDMEVIQMPVDHSIHGASGTIVDDGENRLAYTGDIRFHGPRADLSYKFVEEAKKRECDILIIEGTNMLEGKMDGEKEVFDKALSVVENSMGLVMAGFPLMDIDRIKTFYTVAVETGRTLAVSTRQAFALRRLMKNSLLDGFSLDDIAVFRRKKNKLYAYEKEMENTWPGELLDSDVVRGRQGELILSFSLFDMNEVLDINPDPGSAYLLSSSEPFNEEMELSYERLCNWMIHLGVPVFHIHASGHARPHELRKMIEEISPSVVVPVHTLCPQLFERYIRDLDVKVKLPEEGKKMKF